MLRTKIINYIFNDGSKRTSEKILLKTLKVIQKSSNKNSKNIVKFSLVKASFFLNLKKKKQRQLLIEIPFLLKSSSRISFAIKKILGIVRQKKINSFYFLLKQELFNSLTENNEIFKDKKEIYKKAFTKKAFTHFRWF